MAKRIVKSKRLQEIIKNIADDFRFSHEVDEYALLFYAVDEAKELRGAQIEQMREYVTTGLKELQDNLQWRREFMEENRGMDEMKILENMLLIEQEYKELLDFLG